MSSILARMATKQNRPAADVPLTSARAMRLAMTRAADQALGLEVTVGDVREDMQALDGLIAGLPEDASYIALCRAGVLVGILGFDPQLRAAAVEMQTMRKLAKHPAQARPHTGTDIVLVTPLITSLLAFLPQTTHGSALQGWAEDVVQDDTFDSLRAASLALGDAEYRVMTMTIDLGDGGRQGVLSMALPDHDHTPVPEPAMQNEKTWDVRIRATVMASPATFNAVLHRMSLPLGQIEQLHVGDILPLSGATVGSVQLFAPDDVRVAAARLGQSAGMRAVRLQQPADVVMRDMTTQPKPVSVAAPE